MLQTIVTIIHVLLAAGLIALVLLQRGKGAEAGAAFGSGASGTVFGAQGSASFLSHTTAVLATLFFFTSLGLAYLAGQREGPVSVLETVPVIEESADQIPGLLLPDDDLQLPALPDQEVLGDGASESSGTGEE
ncbi:MAG: preprotein translocase subunit SecG [Gammaproteobacteria bacterium]